MNRTEVAWAELKSAIDTAFAPYIDSEIDIDDQDLLSQTMGNLLRRTFVQFYTDEAGLRELLTRFEQYSPKLLSNTTDCEIFVEESLTAVVIGLVTQSDDGHRPYDELHVVPGHVRNVFQKTCFELVQKYEEEKDETTLAREMATAFIDHIVGCQVEHRDWQSFKEEFLYFNEPLQRFGAVSGTADNLIPFATEIMKEMIIQLYSDTDTED